MLRRSFLALTAAVPIQDHSHALRDGLAKLGQSRGGQYVLPVGVTGWRGVLEIPQGVSIVGQGSGSLGPGNNYGSRLVALDSSAQIRITTNLEAGNRGGSFRDLVIDGAGIGGMNGLVFIDAAVQRSFYDVVICDSAGDGLVIERGQNNRFYNLVISRTKGNGIRLDRGAGGNAFFGIEVEQCGEYTVLCRDNRNDGPYSHPVHNAFYHGVFERTFEGRSKGAVRMTRGEHLLFDSCIFAVPEVQGNDALLQIGGAAPCELFLRDCRLYPPPNRGIAIRQEANAGIFVDGTMSIFGGALGWEFNGGYGKQGLVRFNSVAQEMGGSGDASALVSERR